ncbi:WD40/YVTN/BNR-like repeat-containing protein [Algiphilus sp.]|uniref:WD40/YVTN/BNR-like repeat-containing protein n=1 Tax=Algiphilus sp. TaxID=1872431 RepID=UPI003B51F160
MTSNFWKPVFRPAVGVVFACALPLTAAAQMGGKVDFDALPPQTYDAEIMPRADEDLALDVTWTGSRYIAVGDRGHVLVSSDGKDWVQIPMPTRAALTSLYFVDEDHGWAVGHDAVILHTTDGGRNWELQQFEPGLEEPLHDVFFLDRERGLAVGAYGLAFKTEDGGETWEDYEAPAIRDDEFHINRIFPLSDGRLFAVGEYGMLAVADGWDGEWRRLQPPYDSSFFGGMALKDGGVLVYGLRGTAYISRDLSEVPDIDPDFDPVLGGGESLIGKGWTEIETGTTNSMFGGVDIPDGGYVLVGLNGEILRLSPELTVKARKNTESESPLSAAQLGPNSELILVGEGGIESAQLP